MPEQSAWHTAREPITTTSSALAVAKLPLIEPLLAALPDEGWQTLVAGVRAKLEEKDKSIAETP